MITNKKTKTENKIDIIFKTVFTLTNDNKKIIPSFSNDKSILCSTKI